MPIPEGLRLTIEDEPAHADLKLIDAALDAMNRPFFAGTALSRVGFFLRDGDDRIVGGLDAVLEGGWLFVYNLWIDETWRRRGIGHRLIAEAERVAVERGCHSAWLDTFSFQAPDFYQKLGYTIFATLDYPPDHKRYFLRRKLTP
jgi:ribosomal protein S18 acetylase RimI-like enzyme